MGNENMGSIYKWQEYVAYMCIYDWNYGLLFSVQFNFYKKKKVTKPVFFKKNKTEPEPVQTDRFQFIILEQKQVQTGLAGFSGLARFFFFSVWLGFFLVWLVFFSVRFFQFHTYKTKT